MENVLYLIKSGNIYCIWMSPFLLISKNLWALQYCILIDSVTFEILKITTYFLCKIYSKLHKYSHCLTIFHFKKPLYFHSKRGSTSNGKLTLISGLVHNLLNLKFWGKLFFMKPMPSKTWGTGIKGSTWVLSTSTCE